VLTMMNGQRKLFQAPMKLNTARVAIASSTKEDR
jgi:hypothetical protein